MSNIKQHTMTHSNNTPERIASALMAQVERKVDAWVRETLPHTFTNPSEVVELAEYMDSDHIASHSDIESMLEDAWEAVSYLDTYYHETRERGDLGDVAEACLLILEEYGAEECVGEWQLETDYKGGTTRRPMHIAVNYLVNATAELIARSIASENMVEPVADFIANYRVPEGAFDMATNFHYNAVEADAVLGLELAGMSHDVIGALECVTGGNDCAKHIQTEAGFLIALPNSVRFDASEEEFDTFSVTWDEYGTGRDLYVLADLAEVVEFITTAPHCDHADEKTLTAFAKKWAANSEGLMYKTQKA